MSIRNMTVDDGFVPVTGRTGDRGTFVGWMDNGRAIVWWDGHSGAIDVDPDELTVAGDPQ